jgi:hypothetical protein
MIELDDPRWSELWHCFGSGENVPPLLKKILTAKKDLPEKFWDELQNLLCHQCSTGSASVAAFPHLIQIASENCRNENGFHSLYSAALILAFEIGPRNKINNHWKSGLRPHPEFLFEPFKSAIGQGKELVARMMFRKRHKYDRTMEYLAISGVFALHSQIFLLLPQLRRKEIECFECGHVTNTDKMFTY